MAVRTVIISHFHDDHIGGIAEIVEAAARADVVVSAALQQAEFFAFVAASREALEDVGGNEFARILEVLDARRPGGTRPTAVSPRWTVGDQRLYLRDTTASLQAEVWGIAPPPAALGLSFREIAQMLPRRGQAQRRAIALTPNRGAVVVWVAVGRAVLLLGADLEDGGGPTLGWRAVVASPTRPHQPAHVFKVAHHGSINGHNGDVWGRMLGAEPFALLTPYSAGKKFLPSPEDIVRVNNLTPRGYCTAQPGGWSPRTRRPAVERTLREVATGRRALTSGTVGHVRLRADASQPAPLWSVELFNGALSLHDLQTAGPPEPV
jgi:hypothetical protein